MTTTATGIEIDIPALHATVRQLAETYPNARYNRYGTGCRYSLGTVDDGPDEDGCIVGQAFRLIGIDPAQFDEETPVPPVHRITDEPSGSWISIVQSRQDIGWTWGQALAEADRIMANLT